MLWSCGTDNEPPGELERCGKRLTFLFKLVIYLIEDYSMSYRGKRQAQFVLRWHWWWILQKFSGTDMLRDCKCLARDSSAACCAAFLSAWRWTRVRCVRGGIEKAINYFEHVYIHFSDEKLTLDDFSIDVDSTTWTWTRFWNLKANLKHVMRKEKRWQPTNPCYSVALTVERVLVVYKQNWICTSQLHHE